MFFLNKKKYFAAIVRLCRSTPRLLVARSPSPPPAAAMPAHAHAKAMANLEDDRAERFRELAIAEHRVCAREHKLLKSMLGDGRCGWYMAAHLLLGDSRKWAQAKKLLVDTAAADYFLFIELRAMTAEERDAYFNSMRALNADSEQQFDFTMLHVLGWCMGAPIKVVSAFSAYDDSVYGSELALALSEARATPMPKPICVVYQCSLRPHCEKRAPRSQSSVPLALTPDGALEKLHFMPFRCLVSWR